MSNRHCQQIKQLLHKKRLSKSRFNPQSRIVISTASPLNQSRQIIKRSQSSSSLHNSKKTAQNRQDLECMQKRYQDLYKSYLQLSQQTKKKAQLCAKQQQQIYKYQKAHQRDRKQIQRLKSMIGFVKKNDMAVQTEIEIMQKRETSQISYMRDSKRNDSRGKSAQKFNNKGERSPLESKVELMNKASRLIDKERPSYFTQDNSSKLLNDSIPNMGSSVNLRKRKTHLSNNPSSSDLMIKSQKVIRFPQTSHSRVNSPNSRYKFIPSVEL